MQDNRKTEDNRGQRSATGNVPPWLYGLLIGLAVWFAVAAWIFAGTGATDYLLFIVSGFVFVVVLLQLILSRVARRDQSVRSTKDSSHFSDRKRWDLDIFQSRISFNQAAVQILLPLAAAALGMTAIGIVMHIVEHAHS
jgi:hypothetical protein